MFPRLDSILSMWKLKASAINGLWQNNWEMLIVNNIFQVQTNFSYWLDTDLVTLRLLWREFNRELLLYLIFFQKHYM